MRRLEQGSTGARQRGAARRVRLSAVAAGTALALVVVAGCGDDPEPETKTVLPSVTPTRVVAPAIEEVSDALAWPLTGEVSDKVANRPALSIKVENSPAARPQFGLEKADLVYEEVVEGGITRFIAVYQSKKPDEVGPIRSVRPMDANIVAQLGGLLVYSGGQSAFLGLAPAAGLQVVSMDSGHAGFSRTSSRRAPHNVIGDPDKFWGQVKKGHKKVPNPPFVFAESEDEATAVVSGSDAKELAVTMSNGHRPTWTWDGGEGVFLRSEGSTPATSADGTRLSAKNVVVLEVEIRNTAYRDPAGNPVPETIVIGSGKGLVATGGKTITVKWEKKKQKSPFVLTADGEEVQLAPGNTWIELMPSTRSYEIQ